MRKGKARAALLAVVLMLAACSTGSPGGSGGPVSGPLDPSQVPQRFVPLLQQAGGRYCAALTSAALAGQDKVESGWNAKAVNAGSGAAGLAQFVPGTWKTWGKDANHNGRNSPLDPGDAIDAQARYMCSLVEQVDSARDAGRIFGNVLDLAWSAYNAGLGNVLSFGGVPPFPETQGYVKNVRSWMIRYEKPPPVRGGGRGGWMNPLRGESYTLSSGFGPRGAPCGGCSTWHLGQDMAVAMGTPVKAACSGTVLASREPLGGMGLATVIYCGHHVRTYYAHQSATKVRPGQKVDTGQVIGYSGNSGQSSGPHLHFEIHRPAPPSGNWYAGTPIDPVPFMQKHGAPL